MRRVVVVVPCYNEAKRLNIRAIGEFAQSAEGIELLFVNDGSKDETRGLLERLNQTNPHCCRVLHLEKNSGKAEAVRQGVLQAVRQGADVVGFWDADLATPLVEIGRFCRVLERHARIDMVIGSRMRLLGRNIERTRSRYWLGRLFANTASLALGLRVFDTQCGAKMFRVTPKIERAFAQPFMSRWIFDVEILARLKAGLGQAREANLRQMIYECPLDTWRDVAGSSVRGRDFVKAIRELASIYWTYLRPGATGLAATEHQSSTKPLSKPVVEETRRAA